jgi:hypothetical protein
VTKIPFRFYWKYLVGLMRCSIFWFNDFLTEEYWKILLKVVGKNTDELLKFILKPGIDPYARSVVSQMMGQLALMKPQRRPEIIEWFRKLLNEINTNPEFRERHRQLFLRTCILVTWKKSRLWNWNRK